MRSSRSSILLFILLMGARSEARPQESPSDSDLTRLTPEQLLEFDVVHAASRYRQVRREAPSAITVVTAAEIRSHRYRTLGDVLKSLPSFYVTYDRNYSYIGVRGFSRPGDYNTRVLVLMDGVRLNENVYDGVYLTDGFPLDLAIVDRIEIVRGPAASVYGNGAFFAVIDVITKRGVDLGREVEASAASFGTFSGRASYGRAFGNGLDVAASASGLDSQGQDLAFPELASSETDGLARGLDGEKRRTYFAATTFRGLRLFASRGHREKDVPTAAFGTLFGEPGTRTIDDMTLLGLSYEMRPSTAIGVATRLQHGRYEFRGDYAYGPDSMYHDRARGRWWAAETDVSAELGKRHVLITGLELQWNTQQEQIAYYDPSELLHDIRGRSSRWGLYVQDEARLAASLLASAGVRYDRYQTFRGRVSPRLSLIWNAGRDTTLKALYGEAFRAPNEYELRYYPSAGSLKPETIRGYEVVAEHVLWPGARASASLFDNDVENLISLAGDVDALRFENLGRTRSRGLELTLEGAKAGWTGRVSYSFQRSWDAVSHDELTNSPRHLTKLSFSRSLLRERVSVAADMQHVSRRLTVHGRQSEAFLVANGTVSTRVAKRLDLAATIHNIGGRRFADPGSEEHVQDVIPQDGRSFRLDLSYRF